MIEKPLIDRNKRRAESKAGCHWSFVSSPRQGDACGYAWNAALVAARVGDV